MKKNIAVLSGDGIGPEVIAQAKKALNAIGEKYGHDFTYCDTLIGAISIDKTGEPLSQESIDTCLEADAILLGAVGDPKYDNNPNVSVRPEQGLLQLRKSLGLHTNIRPTTIYPSIVQLSPLKADALKNVDFVIYRELASGIYFGKKGYENEEQTAAYDVCSYTKNEIDTVAQLAFQAAVQRRKKLTLIDKANVLETSRLWRKCIQDMSAVYPEVEVDYLFVDNAAMQMILNPSQFDVVLTSNMFGDIISDQASVLSGSIGLAPSSSIGANTALFEPIHGSYPQAAGQDKANPMATILSAAMLLDYLRMHVEAQDVRDSVQNCILNEVGTTDIFPQSIYKCSDVGDIVAESILEPELVHRLAGDPQQTII